MVNRWGNDGNSDRLHFLGLQITVDGDCSHEIKRRLLLGRKAMINLAAAKLLQSCPTLCNSIDGSPSGSPVPGIFQARTLEWVAIFFSNAWKWKLKVKSLSRVCSDPMNQNMSGLPVQHQLPETIQTHVHWVGEAIQPSHLLLSPYPTPFNLSQNQGLFKWVIFFS